jgi:hypothetical protein
MLEVAGNVLGLCGGTAVSRRRAMMIVGVRTGAFGEANSSPLFNHTLNIGKMQLEREARRGALFRFFYGYLTGKLRHSASQSYGAATGATAARSGFCAGSAALPGEQCAHATLLPAKTRIFVDFVLEAFRRNRLAERFAGSLG